MSPPSPQADRPLSETPALAAEAVSLLQSQLAVLALGPDDARQLLPYWRRLDLAKGSTLFQEGARGAGDHMLLILDGQVSVDTAAGVDNVAMSVVGPGQLLGELALLDDQPRSTTCVALTAVTAAQLTRAELQRMVEQNPLLAARLMAKLAQHLGERLRALGDQLHMYAQVLQQQREALGAGR